MSPLFGPPNVDKLKAKRDVPGLIKALRYKSAKDDWTAWAAARALGEIGDTRAVEPLIAALKDSNASGRKGAVAALGKIGDARAVEPLIAALADSHEVVQMLAADALGDIGDARAVKPLLAAFNREGSPAAAKALDRLGWKPGRDEQGAIYCMVQGKWDECVRIGEPAVAMLVAVATGIRSYGHNPREAAAAALAAIGSDRAMEDLVSVLGKHEAAAVRDAAEQALIMGGVPAVRAILAGLRQNDAHGGYPHLFSVAGYIIGRIGAPAVEPLIAALKDEHWRVRETAVWALAKIAGASAKEHLGAALRDSNIMVRENAARGLARIGAPAAAILIAASQDTDANIRKSVAEGIQDLCAGLERVDANLYAEAEKALEQLEVRGDYQRPKLLDLGLLRKVYGRGEE
jgi:HEAT repeat protein